MHPGVKTVATLLPAYHIVVAEHYGRVLLYYAVPEPRMVVNEVAQASRRLELRVYLFFQPPLIGRKVLGAAPQSVCNGAGGPLAGLYGVVYALAEERVYKVARVPRKQHAPLNGLRGA